ncbi:MAG: sulfite exporter TauE/SafE family protein [Bordetella sp.]|nr:MAG: sulfite exporter TauE/SafE family protein [Bordetella sp.]
MSVFLLFVCLVSGAAVGFLGGLLGNGGGLIAIPALMFLGMSQQLAQGTALIMVLPAITLAVRKYNQRTQIDKGIALTGAAGAVSFTWLGAKLALGINSSTLRLSYAFFLFLLASFYVLQGVNKKFVNKSSLIKPAPILTRLRAAILGMASGMLGGFFGVGGALMIVPIIASVFRFDHISAQALALAMIIPGSTIALITYSLAGQANWLVGIPLAIGSLIFVPLGVKQAYKLSENKLRACFASLLLCMVLMLVIETCIL